MGSAQATANQTGGMILDTGWKLTNCCADKKPCVYVTVKVDNSGIVNNP